MVMVTMMMMMITVMSRLAVQVCSHIARCYSVAAQFEACRTKIQETSAIVKDISYVLYYRVRTLLSLLTVFLISC